MSGTAIATATPDDERNPIVPSQPGQPPARTDMSEWTVDDLLEHVRKVREVMKRAMKEGVHFGTIPGTDKPTIYQPGSQLLALMFRLHPDFACVETRDGDHLEVVSTCVLYHIPTGRKMGSGVGSCATRETRYAYRNSNRKCPKCGKEAIIKGKAEYGGGWVCFKKKDGCGAKWPDNAAEIVKQEVGRIPNPDLPDAWNPVRKIANKRSMATAILNATGASDVFTCDLEDYVDPEAAEVAPAQQPPPTKAPPPRQTVIETTAEVRQADAGEIPDDGMPRDLRMVLDAIAAAQTPIELASCAAAAAELSDDLRHEARTAYKKRLSEITKVGAK